MAVADSDGCEGCSSTSHILHIEVRILYAQFLLRQGWNSDFTNIFHGLTENVNDHVSNSAEALILFISRLSRFPLFFRG